MRPGSLMAGVKLEPDSLGFTFCSIGSGYVVKTLLLVKVLVLEASRSYCIISYSHADKVIRFATFPGFLGYGGNKVEALIAEFSSITW